MYTYFILSFNYLFDLLIDFETYIIYMYNFRRYTKQTGLFLRIADHNVPAFN